MRFRSHQTNLRPHHTANVEINEQANNNIISSNNTRICCDTKCPVRKKEKFVNGWMASIHVFPLQYCYGKLFILFTGIMCSFSSFTYLLWLSVRRCIAVRICVLDDSMNNGVWHIDKIHDEQKLYYLCVVNSDRYTDQRNPLRLFNVLKKISHMEK